MYPIGIQIVQSKKGGNLVMFSKKISRRSFLKVSAVTTAMAAMGLPAFAAEDTAEENCFQTLNIPRATGSTVDKSVLLNESRLYLITDFGAVSEGDPVQNTKAINAAIQAASEAGGGTVVVPAGDFKSYTIRLQSGVNLRIDANGIIRAAGRPVRLVWQPDHGGRGRKLR